MGIHVGSDVILWVVFFSGGKGESNRGRSIVTIKTKKVCHEAVDILPLIFPHLYLHTILFCLFEPKYPSSVK